MSDKKRNLENRSWIVSRLYAEIIGPDPSGEPIEINDKKELKFTWEEFRSPKKQKNGEEILWQDPPIKRYGAGILFPKGLTEQKQLKHDADTTPLESIDDEDSKDVRIDEEYEKKTAKELKGRKDIIEDSEDYDVSLANSYKPSAMGLSFLANLKAENMSIEIDLDFASYKPIKVKVGKNDDDTTSYDREIWLRMPNTDNSKNTKKPNIKIDVKELLESKLPIRKPVPQHEKDLEVLIVSRNRVDSIRAYSLITVCLINKKPIDEGRINENCFFQCGFKIFGTSKVPWILPYPETKVQKKELQDIDEEINNLIYRDRLTFAVGHGCGADWEGERPDVVSTIWTDCMPTYQLPSISADILDKNEKPIKVSMRKLGDLDPEDKGINEIKKLVESYQEWIEDLENYSKRSPVISPSQNNFARIIISNHKECIERIRDGVKFLSLNTEASKNANSAFKLANQAMLVSQLRSSRKVRKPSWKNGRIEWDKNIKDIDYKKEHPDKGYWRAFQIAFILMNIRGIVENDSSHRERVDLIWFPTGGGKTEAYLGLIAFTLFFNRLSGNVASGADVIMRYTLRLLTAQQFQRAAILICAMEYLRRKNENLEQLGNSRFSLGMWVGGGATPNTRAIAKTSLSRLQKNKESENPFVLLKCPWCGAKFGPYDDITKSTKSRSRGKKSPISVLGYSRSKINGRQAETVVFRCYDAKCYFGQNPAKPGNPPLPITVIDEDIYDNPPNLIIGTVDKFAMLAWKPEIRKIFGLDENGKHTGLPPSLIIQDELHLISGPLGSMVGAYETIIHELCIKQENNKKIVPKIVASTATISRAKEQVKALYARENIILFPPSGLEAGDSFFAREDRDSNGKLKPGRLYLGIMAPGHGSQQTTQARIFAALLQYPAIMPTIDNDDSEIDPWWTLVCFFNSLRELGGAATLLVSDTRDYLRVILNRHGIPYKKIRQLLNWEELTGRIRDDKIPLAIQKLEQAFKRDKRGYPNDAIEACLASSIIEVGIDIDRLSLMTIVGQPKTTSQYIQVSSRVGRKYDSPGLIVVSLSQSKPRDRSHYERFRSYHQRLYAQVEPTSVTPFSPPAIDRALHAIVVSAVRQLGNEDKALSPRPFPLTKGSQIRETIETLIKERAEIVDKDEIPNVFRVLNRRIKEWEAWDPSVYGGFGPPPENPPLIYPAGSLELPEWDGHSWPTLNSLRDVDATCEAEITSFYNEIQEDVE